jgi:hypothetical protein
VVTLPCAGAAMFDNIPTTPADELNGKQDGRRRRLGVCARVSPAAGWRRASTCCLHVRPALQVHCSRKSSTLAARSWTGTNSSSEGEGSCTSTKTLTPTAAGLNSSTGRAESTRLHAFHKPRSLCMHGTGSPPVQPTQQRRGPTGGPAAGRSGAALGYWKVQCKCVCNCNPWFSRSDAASSSFRPAATTRTRRTPCQCLTCGLEFPPATPF